MIVLCIIVRGLWENHTVEVNTITIESQKLPQAFDNYRIAQISDFHNRKDNKEIISLLKKTKPDMIAITGDFIDSYHTDMEVSLKFAKELVEIAPCYYVSGNHEARIQEYHEFQEEMKKIGIHILENDSTTIHRSHQSISLVGMSDPSFTTDYMFDDEKTTASNQLQSILKNKTYTILLSHRPELFEVYKNYPIDLILTGHAHGGQFRLPFIGGLIAPNQGLFPQYDTGLYTLDHTNMIVSRGLGNSLFPFRLNNQPEIVEIILKKSIYVKVDNVIN